MADTPACKCITEINKYKPSLVNANDRSMTRAVAMMRDRNTEQTYFGMTKGGSRFKIDLI